MEMYNIGQKIGYGPYSTVREVTHNQTGLKYAMKELVPNFVEIDIMTRYKHPNIVKLFKFWIGKSSTDAPDSNISLFIITELGDYDLSTCNELKSGVTSCRTDAPGTPYFNIIIDMITAVHFLHMNGVIHGDIKPHNFIMVKSVSEANREPDYVVGSLADGSYVAKLIDFGMSGYRDQPLNNCQSMLFAPPEILTKYYGLDIRDAYPYISMMASDIWALGATIFYYLSGTYPFGIQEEELEYNINKYLNCPILYFFEHHISYEWHPLLLLLLDLDPNKRLTNMKHVNRMYKIIVPSISIQISDIDYFIKNNQVAKQESGIFSLIPKNKQPKNFPIDTTEDYSIDDLMIINDNAGTLLIILYKFQFNIEVVFLAMDLYYRSIYKLRSYIDIQYITLACLYIAFQLATNWNHSTEKLDTCIDENQVHYDKVIYVAGYITALLKGNLYLPNLYTGIHDHNILKKRLLLLRSYRTYRMARKKLSQPHTMRKIRIPFNLLI